MTKGAQGRNRILASASPGEVRVALVRDDRLEQAWVERPARPDGVGDLHRARVAAVAPAMAGAFVALAGDETGFLPAAEASPGRLPIGRAVSEGQVLAVRVTRGAQGGKGPRLTARLTAAEAETARATPVGAAPGTPRLLARGPDAVLRLALAFPDAEVVTDGLALAARLRGLLGRDRVAHSLVPAFDDAIEAEFDILAGPAAPLPGGGRLLVHPTPALTAIDVDAGTLSGGRDAQAHWRLNAAAVEEAARQIRLRNLGGAILLDLAGLAARQRAALAAPLTEALAADPLARLFGLGPLGLFEISRRRIHPPLHEVLGWPPSALTRGLAALRRAMREATARPGRRLALRAAPAVLEALRGLPGALDEYGAMSGQALVLRRDATEPGGMGSIEEATDD